MTTEGGVEEIRKEHAQAEGFDRTKQNEELLQLHALILEITQDKYAIPEMMADRITKEVDNYIAKARPIIEKQILSKRLDRPKLREKIAIRHYSTGGESTWKLANDWARRNSYEFADQILALIPDEEEANHKQIRIKRKELFPHGHKDCFECENFVTDLAKKQERERIIKYLKDNTETAFGIPYINNRVLQALEGEE